MSSDREDRKVVFYAEDTESFGYFEGMIDSLTNELNIPICYVTSDPTDPILETENQNIRTFYIHLFLASLISLLDADILLMTMPDLNLFHIKRSKFDVNHAYLFHNIGSSFPVIRHGALFHYDTIFCVGPHHIEEIRRQEKIYGLQDKELIEFGYFRLEKIYRDFRQYKISDASGHSDSKHKARVLLAPTWGENSILNLCGRELISVLVDNDYEVIVRPHPITRDKEPELIGSLNDEFQTLDNYTYEGDISSTRSFYESDVLISDWSGVSFEYAFGTERPVLFIDVPQKIVNPEYTDLGIEPIDVGIRSRIGEVLGVDQLHMADSVIGRLIDRKDAYGLGIIKARQEFVYNFGKSSRVGAEYVRDFLEKKRRVNTDTSKARDASRYPGRMGSVPGQSAGAGIDSARGNRPGRCCRCQSARPSFRVFMRCLFRRLMSASELARGR